MRSWDLTLTAEEDLRGIWNFSREKWGLDLADAYFGRIETCREAVGKRRARLKTPDGLPDGIRIHRCEHRYVFWLDGKRPTVIAVPHERMDFVRRLKACL